MQDYKSVRVAAMIYATLVNRQTHSQTDSQKDIQTDIFPMSPR